MRTRRVQKRFLKTGRGNQVGFFIPATRRVRPLSVSRIRRISRFRFLTILSFCQKVVSAPCIFKTRAILIPLEVYMVNSPSRLHARPPLWSVAA